MTNSFSLFESQDKGQDDSRWEGSSDSHYENDPDLQKRYPCTTLLPEGRLPPLDPLSDELRPKRDLPWRGTRPSPKGGPAPSGEEGLGVEPAKADLE